MSDAQRCDGCGKIRHSHHTEFEFANRVADIESHKDAVDVRMSGDLCVDCGKKVARLIKELGGEE